MAEHGIDTEHSRDEALAAIAKAAELWGADWQPDGWGGRLCLPVTAGLRQGVTSGRVTVDSTATGSRVRLIEEETRHRLNLPAVVILAFGALGAVAVTLWPFYPPLLAVAPVAVVLAFAAWLLVASRLRHSHPQDFLELVASLDPQRRDD